jgi:hypothetical protein
MSNSFCQEPDIIHYLQHLHLYGLGNPIGFERLPPEIVLQIFELLPLEAKLEVSSVNQKWHFLVKPSLYYAQSIYRNSLRDFINCLYYSADQCKDYHNGHYVRELELEKPGGRKQLQQVEAWPITVSDIVYLLQTTPNLTSLVVHSINVDFVQLIYEAIDTCQPLHRMKKVGFGRPLLDSETDLETYIRHSLGRVLYSNFMVMHYYRDTIEQIYIPWSFHVFQTLVSTNIDSFSGFLAEYPFLKKLEIQIPPISSDLRRYWTVSAPGNSSGISTDVCPCPSLISLIENNKKHAFTDLKMGYTMHDQMSKQDYQQLIITLEKNVYNTEYPSLNELHIELGFFSASCIDYITQRFPQISKLNIIMADKDILQSIYSIQCLRNLIKQSINNRNSWHSVRPKHRSSFNPAHRITLIEKEIDTNAAVGFHPFSLEPDFINAYGSLIDFNQLCTSRNQITLMFQNGRTNTSFNINPPFVKPRFICDIQFENSRSFITLRHEIKWHGHFQQLSQFLKQKGYFLHCLTMKQLPDLDIHPRQASFSLLDIIHYCPYVKTLLISGYNEANFKNIALAGDNALTFPRITYANMHNIYWDSPLSCSRLLAGLFPNIQQMYLRYPRFLVGSLDSTAVFDLSAARNLDAFGVDIDFLFDNDIHHEHIIQIELTAISKTVTYDLNLCDRHKKPESITHRRGNLEKPTVVFKFKYLSSLSFFCPREEVMLRLEPKFNDSYYFFSYTKDMNIEHL